ncbi:MAG: glycoside hydrolase family 127 protein [Bacteroidales bacterium]|nr:glycoside hydrolase family 127 protein [Bacteroidales bacterium]
MKNHVVALSLLLLLAAPLTAGAQPWQETSLRDIRPEGWLKEKLVQQKYGLTGHPEALSYPYNTCLWAGEIPRMGTHGQDWWRYEQTAYYTDGLLRLGYLLDDQAFIEKGEAGISYTLEHPWENGRLGSKLVEYTWPSAVFFRAIKAEYDVNRDPAILKALQRHYHSIPLSQLVRKRDIISIEGMLWTASKTGDKALVERADSAFRMRKELIGDRKLSRDDRVTPEFLLSPEPYNMHGVTMSEILKLPIMLYAATGDKWYRQLGESSLRRLYGEDGLPDGLFTSAEWLQGRDIRHSHETCNAVDMSWTLGYYLEILKDPKYADMIEKIVFNAGEGSVTQDFKALQYYSSVNQFIATGTSNHNKDNYCSTWMAYRPTHQTECCAGNIHRLFPNYAARMWLRGEGEAVAALYGPSRFVYSDKLSFVEQTEYPYGQTVTITAEARKGKQQAKLTLRIPGWCRGASLTLNGKPVDNPLDPGTFVTVDRKWAGGDKLELTLPMRAEKKDAYGGGVWFERGPLVYSYAIPAVFRKDTVRYANMNGKYPADDDAFPCWDIRPDGAWNFAVEENVEPEETNNSLRIKVIPIRWDWDRGPNGELLTPDIPANPVRAGEPQYLELTPYGKTTLRLTVFPVLRKGEAPEPPRIAAELNYRKDG